MMKALLSTLFLNIELNTRATLFKLLLLLSFTLILPLQQAQAKTVVLVHGFLSDAHVWSTSGFIKALHQTGYTNGGVYDFNPMGMLVPYPVKSTNNVFYSVELPSQTNLQTQEGILLQYLQHIYSQRQEPLTLVGHSAGGIISRLYLLDPMRVPVNGLITIATPHLGTPTANIAHLASNSPIGMMVSMAGEDALQDSRGLFSDLKEEKPGTFIFWMNHQPHPDIHFASIIRKNESISKPNKFDFIVPPFSQDMNNISSLKGKSGVAITTDNHALNYKDGLVVVDILKHIN